MSPVENEPTYIALRESCEKIDRRNTRYRFDLEKDVKWNAIREPGDYFTPGLLEAFGHDTGVYHRFPEAHDLLQWSFAMATCREFEALEEVILRFTARESALLGPTRSVVLLEEEERKHIHLFQRYGKYLRGLKPEECPRFDNLTREPAKLLEILDARDKYPNAATHHYLFWLGTLFFEEYTIYLHEKLSEQSTLIQPAWLSTHHTHWREEVQHVMTDAYHIAALNLSEEERHTWSRVFFTWLEENYDHFAGFHVPLQMIRDRHPELAAQIGAPGFVETPFFQDICRGPAFRQTRKAAPCIPELYKQMTDEGRTKTSSPTRRSDRKPALISAPPPTAAPGADENVPDRVRKAIAANPDAGVVFVQDDGSEKFERYEDLWTRGETTLAGLRRLGCRKGDSVILQLRRNEDFLGCLWGCFLGGMKPVPLALPTARHTLEEDRKKLLRIHELLDHPLVLVDESLKEFLKEFELPLTVKTATVDEICEGMEPDPDWTPTAGNETAFIQFSSGSTGNPKGVRITHTNILSQAFGMAEHGGATSRDVFVSWMPLYHDMGLFGYHMLPILLGAKQVLMNPFLFIRKPLLWLKKLSDHRGSITAAPNFGLSRVLQSIRPGSLDGLDLSSVRCILNGSEPINVDIMNTFTRKLEPAGLPTSAMSPGYGLAEATLAVTMTTPEENSRVHWFDRSSLDSKEGVISVPEDHPDGIAMTDEGGPIRGCEVRIVDDRERLLKEGVVGRIQVRAPHVMKGYVGHPELDPEDWLRTGDLGLILDGRLCVTGRVKDILFINGRNYYSHDLESIAEKVDGVTPGRIAVIGSRDPQSGAERVVVFARIRSTPLLDEAEVLLRLKREMGQAVGFPVDHVIPIDAKEFPRTTSGKLQRYKLRDRFEHGEFDEIIRRIEKLTAEKTPSAREWRTADLRRGDRRKEQVPIEKGTDRRKLDRRKGGSLVTFQKRIGSVQEIWAQVLQLPLEQIGLDDPFTALGGDSIKAVQVHGRLEKKLGTRFDPQMLFECRTVREMAGFLDRKFQVPADPVPAMPRQERSGKEIAVIGMSCRFPGGENLSEYWSTLKEGRQAIQDPPSDRWKKEDVYDPEPGRPGKTICVRGGWIRNVRGFDPGAFGLSEEESLEIDPQQRIFLEVASEALEHARCEEKNVGIFAGSGGNDYLPRYFRDPSKIGPKTILGNIESMVATRVSQVLGLTGPALTINAACATSLVTVHMACRSLLQGECDVAVAGGVELNLTVQPYLLFSQAGVLSPDGECRPFDEEAAGFVPGEGAGAVVLKPLEKAQADGDPIFAVIRGSAINNDGHALTHMAPNPQGQKDVIRKAYAYAGVDPATISYIEAHAAGTRIGDAIEVRSLTDVFSEHVTRKGACGIGSVKSNIGHLFTAAGISSFIKVVLALHHRRIPGTPGCRTPGKTIGFPDTPFRPVQQLRDWERPEGGVLRAGINAFGVGGTNCHMILEEAPAPVPRTGERDVELFCVSARKEKDLPRVGNEYADFVERHASAPLGELASGINARANRQPIRAAFTARSVTELKEKLRNLRNGTRRQQPPKLAFVFSAPGSQIAGMARHLYEEEPVFQDAISACSALLESHLERPLKDYLLNTEVPAEELDRIDVTQPVVFSFGYALARWLMSVGIQPDGVLGHSAGEYIAACIAGILPLEKALLLVTNRGRCMAAAEPGKMAAVFAPAEKVRPWLRGLEDEVGFAALNEPTQVVISGKASSIDRLLPALEKEGIASQELRIGCAAHSPVMAQAQGPFARHLEEILPEATAKGDLPFYSTMTGTILPHEKVSRKHWIDHLRSPVRFMDAVQSAWKDGFGVFLEVGATASLSHCATQVLEEMNETAHALPTGRRSIPGWETLLGSLATLAELGYPLRWNRLHPRKSLTFPDFPYDRKTIWMEEEEGVHHAPLPAPTKRIPFEKELRYEREPAIRDHQVQGRAIAPAVLLIDMALAAARKENPAATGLGDVLIGKSLPLEPDVPRIARGTAEDQDGQTRIAITSHPADRPGDVEEHLSGILRTKLPPLPDLDVTAIDERCTERVEAAEIYRQLDAGGLSYGPSMLGIVEVRRGKDELIARIEPPPSQRHEGVLDPAILDGAMQSIGGFFVGRPAEPDATFLGFAIREVSVFDPAHGPCIAHVRLKTKLLPQSESIRCDVTLAAPSGRILVHFEEVCLKRFRTGNVPVQFYALRDREAPAPTPTQTRAPVIVSFHSRLGKAVREKFSAEGDGSARLVLDPSLNQLRSLAQGWMKDGIQEINPLLVASLDPEIFAFLRVLGQEQPGWRCRGVKDLSAENITREWNSAGDHFEVSYASGRRTVPVLETVRPVTTPSLLRKGGVYWITGGAGGIGLALARKLATDYGARLVLTSRNPKKDPGFIDEIRAAGGDVLLLPADVTRPEEMKKVVEETFSHWGELNGVIHAAGILDDEMIRTRQPERAAMVLAPKIAGADNLLEAVRDRKVDFVLLCSSLASLFGGVGQSDYAAGNAHLNRLAAEGENIFSIQWGPWSGAGMVADEKYQAGFQEQGITPFSPEQGAKVFLDILRMNEKNVAAIRIDPAIGDIFRTRFNLLSPAEEPETAPAIEEPAASVHDFIRATLAERLRCAPAEVDPGQSFAKMGVDSLMAVQMVKKLERTYGIRLYPTLLFEYQTVDALAAHLEKDVATAAPPKKVEATTPDQPLPVRVFLLDLLSKRLRCRPEEIDSTMPFAKMGVDSLMAVQMVKSLERNYEIRLYPTLLFEMKTVNELAAYLEKESPVSTPEPVPVPAPVDQGHEAWMVGKEEGLSLSKMPLRAPGEGEIEVVVRAIGVNFIDILASVGMHPQIRENAFVPGHEVSGVVVATGPNTSAFRPGDRVMAVTPSGGYATRAILPAATTLPLPANLTFEEGASILITGITAVACLEHYGRLQAGEKILIQAAAGATGLACVQLAGHIGATIFGTSSAPEKLARLRSLGVSYPINYREVDFADEVRRITDGAGVDVVVDSLSGDAIGKGLDLLKPGGRFIEIGAAGVVEVPGVDPTKLFLKNQQFMAVNVMQLSENPALLDRLRNRLLELLREGILTPSIGHRLPFRDAEKAHRLIRERKNMGKIVLLVDPGQKEGAHVGPVDA